jgi:hypothetical protein
MFKEVTWQMFFKTLLKFDSAVNYLSRDASVYFFHRSDFQISVRDCHCVPCPTGIVVCQR